MAVTIEMMKYPAVLRTLVAALALTSIAIPAPPAGPSIAVYKTPTCGCCSKWVDHLRANGFKATVTDVQSTAEYRLKYGVPERLQSCHTAIVNGYAIEGHVPAADIKALLKKRPKARGIAVPGMPIGSPGMEQGPRREAYSVILFTQSGDISEFNKYPAVN